MTSVSLNRCPECGYTKEDALIHWDRHLCKGKIPGYDTEGTVASGVANPPAGLNTSTSATDTLIECVARIIAGRDADESDGGSPSKQNGETT